MQRWVRAKKVERFEGEGWKKTGTTRHEDSDFLMEKADEKPEVVKVEKPKRGRKSKK